MSHPFQFALRAIAPAIFLIAAGAAAQPAAIGPPPGDLEAEPGESALTPVVRWAEKGVAALEQVKDYTARLIKRERIEGRLEKSQQLFVKIRHRPLSVYARFETTDGQVTQEVMYVDGKNRNRMWVHSERRKILGTVSVYPESRIALRESRYPLTQIGLLELTKQLAEHARKAMDVPDTQVQLYRDATINGRPALALAVTHAQPHKNVTYQHARVFIDLEWNVPVRYEAYDFPAEPGEAQRLLEQYTYLDLAFNVGLTDADFDIRNPAYSFPIHEGAEEDNVGETPRSDETPAAETPREQPQPIPATPPVRPALTADFAAHAATAERRLAESPTYRSLVIRNKLVDGRLSQGEFLELKFRRQPLGVYVRGFWPPAIQEQRILFAANQNSGQAVARLAGDAAGARLPLVELQQRMRDDRLITHIGIETLLAEAVAAVENAAQPSDIAVRRYSHARIDSTACVCFEITRTALASENEIYRRRVFFDKQRHIPIRFEVYASPAATGGAPQLIEAITFRNIVLDARLVPLDFDAKNPAYGLLPAPVAAK